MTTQEEKSSSSKVTKDSQNEFENSPVLLLFKFVPDSRVPALTRNFLDLTFQGASGNVHLLVATGEGSRNKHRRRDVEFLFLEVVRLRLGFYNFCNMLTSI